MKITVQQCFRDPEFREGPYMEIRLRAKRLGNLRPGDVVEVTPDKNGNLIIKRREVGCNMK
jgi:exosome complex RNA-binding protein Rrp4